MARKAPEWAPGVGQVAAMPVPLGGFGACQVTGTQDGTLVICALDWFSDAPPTLDDLRALGPLRLTHHAHNGSPAVINVPVDDPSPVGFHWLGEMPVHPELPTQSRSYSNWFYLPSQVAGQRRWDLRLPEPSKTAYREAGTRPGTVVRVDVGGGDQDFRLGTSHLDLGRIAPEGEVRWAALDQLPHITSVRWTGPERGLAAALAARPMIDELTWDAPVVGIDLAATELTGAILTGEVRVPGPVRLPGTLTSLRLAVPVGVVEVLDSGHWVCLTLQSPNPVLPAGLDGVRDLTLDVRGQVALKPFLALRDLTALRVRFDGPPGSLLDPMMLTSFEHLAELELFGGYGMEANALPVPDAWPSLRYLKIDGLRSSTAKALRAAYRRWNGILDVRGAKSDTWLAANLDNPFRDWVEDDGAGGKAACKAYRAAVRAIDRDPGEGASALRTLVTELNTINERRSFIDTLRREEAGEAFATLARRAGIAEETAMNWFDEWRDF